MVMEGDVGVEEAMVKGNKGLRNEARRSKLRNRGCFPGCHVQVIVLIGVKILQQFECLDHRLTVEALGEG